MVLAAAALSGLVLTGCDDGPSQVGAAAIVGDDRVTVSDVQGALEDVLNKEGDEAKAQLVAGQQLDDVTLQIINQRISHLLIDEAAKRNNISVDEARISQAVEDEGGAEEASAGTIFDAAGFRERIRDELLLAELGRVLLPKLSVTVDYTTSANREDAAKKVRELADAGPERARQLIEADVRSSGAAGLEQRIVGLENPSFAAAPVFGTPEGSVVTFPAEDESGGWLVMVVSRRVVDLTPTAADRRSIAALDPALLQAVGLRQLAIVADDLDIKISPRYGVWDPISVSAVRSDEERVGFTAELHKTPST